MVRTRLQEANLAMRNARRVQTCESNSDDASENSNLSGSSVGPNLTRPSSTSTPSSANSFDSTVNSINNQLEFETKSKKYSPNDFEKQNFELLFKKLNDEAANGVFNDKIFTIKNKTVKKSPIFNFFHSKTVFPDGKPAAVEFVCIICYSTLSGHINTVCSNLNHHLKRMHVRHKDNRLENWFNSYDKFNGKNEFESK